jgi:hypothetical protein
MKRLELPADEQRLLTYTFRASLISQVKVKAAEENATMEFVLDELLRRGLEARTEATK